MDPLHQLAEARIAEALARGELDNPLAGEPLAPEDLAGVPDELRMPYKILRDAGMLPPELELRRSLLRMEDLLGACTDEVEKGALREQLTLQRLRPELLLERRRLSGAARGYLARVQARLAGR